MSDEVRKAAGRCTAAMREESEGVWVCDKCGHCIDATDRKNLQVYQRDLAEHPADDDEPVTEEWLLLVGFIHNDDGTWMRVRGAQFGTSGPLRHTQVAKRGFEWLANGLGCSPCETRRDVRRLCRALGIPLKERA